jgi:protein-tyrosine phosphatase
MQQADWTTHRIEGYARAAEERGLPSHFSAPLISPVVGNLWQGGCINGVELPDDFHAVVSLYPWEKYRLGPKTTRVELRWYDFAEMPDMGQLNEAVDTVHKFTQQGKTLVHCQAGLNRSGLVAALYLIRYQDFTPQDAVALLREQRSPMALCNETFERWLLNDA